MTKSVLFFMTLFMTLMSTSSWSSSLPEVNYPDLSQLNALKPPVLVKDDYETSAEFEKRKKDAESSNRAAVNFVGELDLEYDADKQAYLVATCFEKAVVDNTSTTSSSGTNAMGAEWSWLEIDGTIHQVVAGSCGGRIEIPYDLSNARAIRNSVKAVGTISLGGQEPSRSRPYETPEWGKSVVRNVTTYTYKGEVDEIYIGSPEKGVIASTNVKQAREEDARKLIESLESGDLSCPSSKAGMTAAVRKALDDGNIALYRGLAKCPKPAV